MAENGKAIEVKVSKDKKLENIGINTDDVGNYIVRWTIYTPSKTNSGSMWDEHTKVFLKKQEDDAWEFLKSLFQKSIK